MKRCVLLLLLLFFLNSSVSSLYFHIRQAERKCFLEDLPEETAVTGTFKTLKLYDEHKDELLPANQDELLPANQDELLPANQDELLPANQDELQMFVEVKDPDDQLVLSRWYRSEGTFTFTSLSAGRHLICLQPDSPQRPLSAGHVLVVHLDIRRDERTKYDSVMVGGKKLTELQLRVQQLSKQVHLIQKEMDYQKFREERFRQLDLSTNMWIFWWPVVRSLYVVGVIVWNTKSW